MDDKELQELDLEAIIREFKDYPDDDPPEELPAEEQPPEEGPEDSAQQAVTGDTIRIDPALLPRGEYSGAQPLDEEGEPVQEYAPPQPQEEPFSDQWEPEYEQPMGEYTPPQPLHFHPNPRLRELKRKLVAGPERKYYELSEKGTGRLQALIFICALVSLICAGSTVLYELGLVPQTRMKLLIFGQLLAMLLCALLGSHQLIEGLADITKGRFSLNSLLIVSFALCSVDGVLCLQQQRVPCCAAFTLQVCMSLCRACNIRKTQISQMDTMRRATSLTAVRPAGEPVEGRQVLLRDEGQVEDYMDTYSVRTVPQKVLSWYALGALAATLAVGITAGVLLGVSRGIQVAAVTLLAAVPASMFLCLSRPQAILEKRLHKLGTVLCGWAGQRRAAKASLFPVAHSDLFPAGTVKMNGVKFFGSRSPDEVVAYGTAVITADGSGLSELFIQLLESRNCHHLRAEELQHYPGGIGGLVRGEPVLVGTLSFLKDMGVEIPEGLRVSQALCVAVDGSLCGLFAITYEKARAAAAGLSTLNSYSKLTPVFTGGDLLVTGSFLRSRFGINPKRMIIADHELRGMLAELTPAADAPAIVLSTRNDLAGLAFGVTGARSLHTASWLGLIVHMAGGIIGIGIMLTLTILGAVNLLTPLNVLLYQLVWSIPGLLFTEWTRLI